MCQKELKVFKKDILLAKKPERRLDLPTEVFGLSSFVTTVRKIIKKNNLILLKLKDIFVQLNVIQIIARKLCNQVNIIVGKAGLPIMKHIEGGLKDILNEWHISKPEDMQEKETQKVHTLLKSGKNLKGSLKINVLFAGLKDRLLKTISNLFRWEEQITSQISSHCVGIVIVGSGRSFNIYEIPNYLTPNN